MFVVVLIAGEGCDFMPDNTPIDPGLCRFCQHMQRTTTRRGSVFYLCLLARVDTRFRKYPPLPVQHCPGYTPQAHSSSTEQG
jgi:hypothetical protein